MDLAQMQCFALTVLLIYHYAMSQPPCSSVPVVKFEHVIAGWVRLCYVPQVSFLETDICNRGR